MEILNFILVSIFDLESLNSSYEYFFIFEEKTSFCPASFLLLFTTIY